ncbi:hypothetical protein ABAC460_06565 [Asticcacaulis sp. AC460]|uniref:TetR/AcrR family transcriptional regulator n=1 Tax=Asticcacaulis sp. AC460 TaxID=1282360 RepID=UPI0003C3F753|nr:TetR/AcrR family transcriptional regulator [Asticcacaulis sp. AC460]ESQ91221.1 hypothetical protein ABAC460_06565 [Asticcacaulis sp. AC460]
MDAPAPNFRDQRRERILQVAREVFFEVGYAGASMSTISSRLGGSKATLYAYFSSKEELFGAIVRESCQAMADVFEAHIGTDDLRQSLTVVARQMVGMIVSEWGTNIMQLVIEEGRRNPNLPQMFQEAIESNGRRAMRALLTTAHDRGQIAIPDVDEAAVILKSLIFGDLHFKRVLNLAPPPSEAQLHHHIDVAIDVFLTYFACKADAVKSV